MFNKPYGVLSQFTDADGRQTLKDFISTPGIYPAGRLDKDSEGLLLLTNNGRLQHKIAHPNKKMPKTYWIQLEGVISPEAITHLEQGVELNDGKTKPTQVRRINEPEGLWARNPPIRERKNIPTCWLALTLWEGRNRQVRRMTAAVGYPTLRLIRASIGPWQLKELQPGQWKQLSAER